MKIKYDFKALPWIHNAPGGWWFVALPTALSEEIRMHLGWQEEGWGRLKSTAKINHTEWKTAIWFDTKRNTYLLPLKSEVRKKESIQIDVELNITISI